MRQKKEWMSVSEKNSRLDNMAYACRPTGRGFSAPVGLSLASEPIDIFRLAIRVIDPILLLARLISLGEKLGKPGNNKKCHHRVRLSSLRIFAGASI